MVEHLAFIAGLSVDPLLSQALEIGKAWSNHGVPSGPAMQMSRSIHKQARELASEEQRLFYRAVGHAVATAHMADHSLGPIYYGRKLLVLKDLDANAELAWQLRKLEELCPSLHATVEKQLVTLL